MKKQAGFTLIELIMVIVILGILSAFALPRFADLSNEANDAALDGALASMKSTSAIMHASSLAQGTTGLDQAAVGATVSMEGSNYLLKFGYPAVSGVVADLDAADAANLTADFTVTYTDAPTTAAVATAAAAQMHVTSSTVDGEDCFYYQEAATANGTPTFFTGTWDNANAWCD
ncbi:type II secretion system protein [Reinekea sp. G2M2-21]|uniref:type II secretion system protein n=1 Tax=Reinekea sp. G2M2-21 TaxID=2788942 RepID=UPI0018A9EE1A|nr:type II secretion system protein [Reinekea sp. G2M2-21]